MANKKQIKELQSKIETLEKNLFYKDQRLLLRREENHGLIHLNDAIKSENHALKEAILKIRHRDKLVNIITDNLKTFFILIKNPEITINFSNLIRQSINEGIDSLWLKKAKKELSAFDKYLLRKKL